MAESLQIQKISKAWQERLVDLEIENPTMPLGQIARELNVSPSHLSVVRNSDAFREYRALRMQEHQSRVSEGVVARTQRVALKSLEVMEERIERERATIGLALVKDISEMTLNSLGYGPKSHMGAPSGVSVNINHNEYTLNPDERAAFNVAREKLRLVNEHNTRSIQESEREKADDAEVIEGSFTSGDEQLAAEELESVLERALERRRSDADAGPVEDSDLAAFRDRAETDAPTEDNSGDNS